MKIKRLIREALLEQSNLLNKANELLGIDADTINSAKKQICSGKGGDRFIKDNLELVFDMYEDDLEEMLKSSLDEQLSGKKLKLHMCYDLNVCYDDFNWFERRAMNAAYVNVKNLTSSNIIISFNKVDSVSVSYEKGRIDFSIKVVLRLYSTWAEHGEWVYVDLKGFARHQNNLVFKPEITSVSIDSEDWLFDRTGFDIKIDSGFVIIWVYGMEFTGPYISPDIKDLLNGHIKKSFDLCKMV